MIVFAVVLLFILIVLGMYIGPVLALLGVALEYFYSDFPLISAVGDIGWNASIDFILVAVPLFVLMGEILLRSGVTDRMYQAIDPWVSWLPGRLMHTNIGSAALFAATTGSSIATAAAISTVSLPNMSDKNITLSSFSARSPRAAPLEFSFRPASTWLCMQCWLMRRLARST